jgi:hypothetical protein
MKQKHSPGGHQAIRGTGTGQRRRRWPADGQRWHSHVEAGGHRPPAASDNGEAEQAGRRRREHVGGGVASTSESRFAGGKRGSAASSRAEGTARPRLWTSATHSPPLGLEPGSKQCDVGFSGCRGASSWAIRGAYWAKFL